MRINSMHAEHHALSRLPRCHQGYDGLTCTILTLSRTDGIGKFSCPCMNCVKIMHKAGIDKVRYIQCLDGRWDLVERRVSEMYNPIRNKKLDMGFARHMKLSPA